MKSNYIQVGMTLLSLPRPIILVWRLRKIGCHGGTAGLTVLKKVGMPEGVIGEYQQTWGVAQQQWQTQVGI
jgi:hypothetical protein